MEVNENMIVGNDDEKGQIRGPLCGVSALH